MKAIIFFYEYEGKTSKLIWGTMIKTFGGKGNDAILSREHEHENTSFEHLREQAVLWVTRDKIIKDQGVIGTCNTNGRTQDSAEKMSYNLSVSTIYRAYTDVCSRMASIYLRKYDNSVNMYVEISRTN